MKRNNIFSRLLILPFLLSQSREEITSENPFSLRPLVGGQAIIEGVMMRNGDVYGLAVRRQDASIVACRRKWHTFFPKFIRTFPLLRGFPILIDTIYNGVSALNRSAVLVENEECQKLSRWQLVLSMILALVMAIALFVVAPHLLSLVMFWLDVGGNVDGLSFHIWDGFYKMFIFFGYLWGISLMPEIHRVFCFHGAEHKTIHAFETVQEVSTASADEMSRFHPRCGTTFLLFVITLSIILHAICVPPLIALCMPLTEFAKHALTILFKILLILPISAVSYEIIKVAAKLKKGFGATLLQAPGLFLQRLTTREPDDEQLSVAVAALHIALDSEDRFCVKTVPYTIVS